MTTGRINQVTIFDGPRSMKRSGLTAVRRPE
jgi:hypothetical protein